MGSIGNRDYGKWKSYKIIVELEMTLAGEIEFEPVLDYIAMTNTGSVPHDRDCNDTIALRRCNIKKPISSHPINWLREQSKVVSFPVVKLKQSVANETRSKAGAK